MRCPTCGTEIADKALICFRCGSATTEPRHRPPETARGPGAARRARLTPWAVIGLLMLVAAGLFLGRASGDLAPAWVGWTVLAVALGVLVWRLRSRS